MARNECKVGGINLHRTTPDDISATHNVGELGDHWWLDIGPVTIYADGPDALLDIATKVITSVLDIVPDKAVSDDKLLDMVRSRLVLANA
jgi:hypothetical protein